MERAIFKDAELQRKYEEDGFVVVPFLNDEEIKELAAFYMENKIDIDQGFHATIHSKNADYRRKISKHINNIFNEKAHRFMDRFKPVFANYTVKEPSPTSDFDLHLDWSMVDERKHVSITIWTPLIDITDENGHLWVMKGSHKFDYTIRGGLGLRLWCENTYGDEIPTKFERVKMKLKAGTAYIYDHRIFHGSPPNHSDGIRIALNYTMIPEEAPSIHYHFQGDDKVELFEVPEDFYNSHIIETFPKDVKSLGFQDVNGSFLKQNQVNSMILQQDIPTVIEE